MSEWNQPNPMQIGGFKPVERHFNLAKYGRHYPTVNADGSIGKFYETEKIAKAKRARIEKSKYLVNHMPTKQCKLCSGYMVLSGKGGYTCQNGQCIDKRNLKKHSRIELKRREQGKSKHMPRISTKQLENILA